MTSRAYEAGDAVWAPDAYHSGDPELVLGEARPWLILSIPETYPPHGDDYLCCALTSVPRKDDPHFLALADKDWVKGRSRKPSWIDTRTLLTLKHDWIERYLGRVADSRVNQARRVVKRFF